MAYKYKLKFGEYAAKILDMRHAGQPLKPEIVKWFEDNEVACQMDMWPYTLRFKDEIDAIAFKLTWC